jgi:inosine/xanthosine triphosphate pyrophosphatase family protein
LLIFFYSAAIKKLRSVDDSFRKQLEAKELAHQTEINNLEQEKQAELDKAYQKVGTTYNMETTLVVGAVDYW